MPKNRKSKLTAQAIDSIKEPGTYFFTDSPAVALRVSKNKTKSIYASYSIKIGIKPDGKYKFSGRYKFICRHREKSIQEIKEHISKNKSYWQNEINGKKTRGDTVKDLVKDFLEHGITGYRVRKKGSKIKYKKTTIDHISRLLKTYVLLNTSDSTILETLTGKQNIKGSWNTDILGEIKLGNLTKQHIINFHERLSGTPYIANRVVSALSTVFTWDLNRPNPMLKREHNPCNGISKFEEKKDKKHLPIEKVLEINSYIENNISTDPHFLTFYSLLLELGERPADIHGLAWKKPDHIDQQLETTGWIVDINSGEVFLRDSKDRKEATVYLTDQGIKNLRKLQNLLYTEVNWAIGSIYIFPRITDISKHIDYSSYRKKFQKFNYRFGLSSRKLVRSFGSRKLYSYTNHFNIKHLRKTFVTHFGNTHGLQAASERMRHSSVKVTKDHYYSQDKEKFKVKNVYEIDNNIIQFNKGLNK
jgi:integrase